MSASVEQLVLAWIKDAAAPLDELLGKLNQQILALDPAATLVFWPRQAIVSYGLGRKKNSEHYAYLALYASHVNLGFYRGSTLPDPLALLQGTGKGLRHVKLLRVEDLQKPGLTALLTAAKAERVLALG